MKLRDSLFLCLLCLSACKGGQPPSGRPPVPVAVAPAEKISSPVYVEAIGSTSSSQTVDIVPQVSGILQQIHFTQGADLKAGDLLFTIDRRPFEASLAEAKAAVAKADAELVLSEATLKRSIELHASKYVSDQDLDTLKAKVRSNEADLESKRAAAQTAQIQLDYCTIRSPLDGVAGTYHVYAGNLVSPSSGTPLVNIQNVDLLYIDFTLPERELLQVKEALAKHAALKVEVSSLSDARIKSVADLKYIDNRVNPQTGTIMLRAVLHNEARTFWPGQSVQVRVILQEVPESVVIPIPALQFGQQGPFVFIVTPEHKAALRPVKPGQRQQGNTITILEGINAGDQVVTAGHLMLAPDSPVMVMPPQQGNPQAAQAQGQGH